MSNTHSVKKYVKNYAKDNNLTYQQALHLIKTSILPHKKLHLPLINEYKSINDTLDNLVLCLGINNYQTDNESLTFIEIGKTDTPHIFLGIKNNKQLIEKLLFNFADEVKYTDLIETVVITDNKEKWKNYSVSFNNNISNILNTMRKRNKTMSNHSINDESGVPPEKWSEWYNSSPFEAGKRLLVIIDKDIDNFNYSDQLELVKIAREGRSSGIVLITYSETNHLANHFTDNINYIISKRAIQNQSHHIYSTNYDELNKGKSNNSNLLLDNKLFTPFN